MQNVVSLQDYRDRKPPPTGNADDLTNQGLAAYEAGDLPAALSLYRDALFVDPKHPTALYNTAIAQEDLGHIAAAIDSYETCLASDPSFADAHFNLARLLKAKADAHMKLYRELQK